MKLGLVLKSIKRITHKAKQLHKRTEHKTFKWHNQTTKLFSTFAYTRTQTRARARLGLPQVSWRLNKQTERTFVCLFGKTLFVSFRCCCCQCCCRQCCCWGQIVTANCVMARWRILYFTGRQQNWVVFCIRLLVYLLFLIFKHNKHGITLTLLFVSFVLAVSAQV